MKEKLFKSKTFYYVFMIWVGLDFFNSLFRLSTGSSSEFITFNIIKYMIPIIALVTFLAFFIDFKINQAVFKIYIYFRGIIMSLFYLLFALKEFVLYGIGLEWFPADFYFTVLFSLIVSLILLFFYRKFKKE